MKGERTHRQRVAIRKRCDSWDQKQQCCNRHGKCSCLMRARTELRQRKAERDKTGKLYTAAQKFIEAYGGKALVVGPVEIQQWPGENEHCYRLAIKFTGRKPETTP